MSAAEADYIRKLRRLVQTPTEVLEVIKFLIFSTDAPQPLFDGSTKTTVSAHCLLLLSPFTFFHYALLCNIVYSLGACVVFQFSVGTLPLLMTYTTISLILVDQNTWNPSSFLVLPREPK